MLWCRGFRAWRCTTTAPLTLVTSMPAFCRYLYTSFSSLQGKKNGRFSSCHEMYERFFSRSLSLSNDAPCRIALILPSCGNPVLEFPCLQAEVAAVVMTGGLAHVCLVTSHMTVTRARIEMNIPRKRAGSSDHRKAISRFYEAVYQV